MMVEKAPGNICLLDISIVVKELNFTIFLEVFNNYLRHGSEGSRKIVSKCLKHELKGYIHLGFFLPGS